MHIHMPPMRTPRARHMLEALLVVVLIILSALAVTYVLRQRTAPAPAAVTTQQTGLERFREFKEQQAEAREPIIVPLAVTAQQTGLERFREFKEQQAEAREPIVAPARSTGLTPGATRFADMKQRQAETREPAVPAMSVLVDPATQSVLDYLREHSN
jgi:hypothetical protein